MLLTTKNVQTSCPSVALLPLSMCTIRHHWNGSTHTDKTKHSGSSRNNVQLFHLSVPQADKQPSLAGYPLVDTSCRITSQHTKIVHISSKNIFIILSTAVFRSPPSNRRQFVPNWHNIQLYGSIYREFDTCTLFTGTRTHSTCLHLVCKGIRPKSSHPSDSTTATFRWLRQRNDMGSSLRCFLWFLEISRVLPPIRRGNRQPETSVIKCSKTDQFHNIYLSKTDTDLCPVTEYLTQQPDGPLFISQQSAPLPERYSSQRFKRR